MIGLAGAAAALARRAVAPRVIATGVFALGALAYLLVRTDLFHTAPLAVMVAVLARLGARRHGRSAASPPRSPAWRSLYAIAEGLDRRWLVLREDTVALDLPVADGVRVPPRQAAELEARRARACAAAARSTSPRGAPTCVTSGHPLLYVLAGRPNPTRYDIAAPGRRHLGARAARDRRATSSARAPRSWCAGPTRSPRRRSRTPPGARAACGCSTTTWRAATGPAGRFGSFLLLERRAP